MIIVLHEALSLFTDFSCWVIITNLLFVVAIRGKLVRDEAKRIKEKTLQIDNKFTNKS